MNIGCGTNIHFAVYFMNESAKQVRNFLIRFQFRRTIHKMRTVKFQSYCILCLYHSTKHSSFFYKRYS